ncbi:peptidoglycan-binding domain-containing protein [Pelagovum pacificum]|uniref:Peptidoglycan-binding protein n=1 Tax=Pelagovum pacificum TaxID=2588711 RepID=A0A5C5GED3_9RHOB|nr:peptidoglycan-binding domain-containing protein [Pelagovum pacificum]QQA44001.1 peptidoglycan-binding protein [Pelagovum pacificum]TNY32870.1 peptidoglycan-binding protein [Pelagovum pacificum]
MIRFPPPMIALAVMALAACDSAGGSATRIAPEADRLHIAQGDDGLCYGRTISPALIETVTEQVMIRPATVNEAGEQLQAATFETVTEQRILRERTETEFETLCPQELTADFVGSLQRALTARGSYAGRPTEAYDRATQVAVQEFQESNGGPSSPVISRYTAVQLGLVELRQDELDRLDEQYDEAG